MKELPILFSTPMVQSILEGRKTMTRRLNGLDKIPKDTTFSTYVYKDIAIGLPATHCIARLFKGQWVETFNLHCPYGEPGDLLWVRETWCKGITKPYHYAASVCNPKYDKPDGGWKPSIHMPKAAARIWLQVQEVRIERLHDITDQDAIAEGIKREVFPQTGSYCYYFYPCNDLRDDSYIDYPKTSFYSLWKSINGKQSWDANPWVWVISYQVLSTTGKPDLIEPNKN